GAVAFSERLVQLLGGAALTQLKLAIAPGRLDEVLHGVGEASDFVLAGDVRNAEKDLSSGNAAGRMGNIGQRADDEMPHDVDVEGGEQQGADAERRQIPRGVSALIAEIDNAAGALGVGPGDGVEIFVDGVAQDALGSI